MSWRRQNQLLRAAFAGIEAEAVPLSLSLVPTPHRVAQPFAGGGARLSRPGRGRRVLAALSCGVAAAGVFVLALWPVHMPPMVDVMPVGSLGGSRQTGSSTEMTTLLDHASTTAATHGIVGEGKGRKIMLPDLSRAGFALMSVAVYDDAIGPVACGTYMSGGRKRMALCAEHEIGDAHARQDLADTDPRVWRQGETLYSVAGEGREADLRDMSDQIRAVMSAAKP